MEINIWSDVRCPFCYIGKHKFERALEKFGNKDKIKVIWHSFELDPNLKTNPELDPIQELADKKGLQVHQIRQMMEAGAGKMAREMGLTMNFENAVVANSFNAHRLIQLAKIKGLADEMEEALFEAHFRDSKNIDDKTILRELGQSVGLKEADLDRTLFTDEFADKVEQDKRTAAQIGVRGVPFFVFNNKYAVSGAQPEEAFLEVLEKSWSEYTKANQPLIINEGRSCDVDGNCD